VIFPNKTGIKSKKKRSLRAVVFFLRAAQKPIIIICFFSIDRAKTEAYEREMKERKENQMDTKLDIIIMHAPSRKKRMLRSI
jgi:hypothetical protein